MTSKSILSIKTSIVIQLYSKIIDVSSYFEGIDEIELYEHDTGLLQWYPSVCGNNVFYEYLARKVGSYYPSSKQEYSVAASCMPANAKVLEIGCGNGSFGRMFSLDNWYGVDINGSAITDAKKHGLNCEIANIFSDTHNFSPPFLPDFICSFQMIEHLENPGMFFSSVAKYMNADSFLLVGFPAHDSILGMLDNPYTPLNLPPHHQTWWTDAAIREFPSTYGFECLDIKHCPLDEFHSKWFFSTLVLSLLQQRYPGLSTRSFLGKIVKRIVVYAAKIMHVGEVFADSRFGFRGQSCIAIYKLSGN